jgi:hypothetical protein
MAAGSRSLSGERWNDRMRPRNQTMNQINALNGPPTIMAYRTEYQIATLSSR